MGTTVRELSLSSLINCLFVLTGQAQGSIWLDEVSCNGTESRLSECNSSGIGQHECSHWEDAGVVCSDDFVLRLVNSQQILKEGQNVSEGRLEVFICLFVCLFVV